LNWWKWFNELLEGSNAWPKTEGQVGGRMLMFCVVVNWLMGWIGRMRSNVVIWNDYRFLTVSVLWKVILIGAQFFRKNWMFGWVSASLPHRVDHEEMINDIMFWNFEHNLKSVMKFSEKPAKIQRKMVSLTCTWMPSKFPFWREVLNESKGWFEKLRLSQNQVQVSSM
jgi:hypothetical protein